MLLIIMIKLILKENNYIQNKVQNNIYKKKYNNLIDIFHSKF